MLALPRKARKLASLLLEMLRVAVLDPQLAKRATSSVDSCTVTTFGCVVSQYNGSDASDSLDRLPSPQSASQPKFHVTTTDDTKQVSPLWRLVLLAEENLYRATFPFAVTITVLYLAGALALKVEDDAYHTIAGHLDFVIPAFIAALACRFVASRPPEALLDRAGTGLIHGAIVVVLAVCILELSIEIGAKSKAHQGLASWKECVDENQESVKRATEQFDRATDAVNRCASQVASEAFALELAMSRRELKAQALERLRDRLRGRCDFEIDRMYQLGDEMWGVAAAQCRFPSDEIASRVRSDGELPKLTLVKMARKP